MNFRAHPARANPADGPPTRQVRRRRPGQHASGGRPPGPPGDAQRGRPPRDSVLSIKPFRALWIGLALWSLGDWLSILALTELAANLTKSGVAQNSAVGGVWVVTL